MTAQQWEFLTVILTIDNFAIGWIIAKIALQKRDRNDL